MKKMFTVLFAGMLLLAFAGVASADHKIWNGPQAEYTFAVGGQIEIDGWYKDEFFGTALNDDVTKYYNQETRVAFHGNWGAVEGLIRLEWDYDWDQVNHNKGNSTQNNLGLAWLKFPVPGTPVAVKAGLQNIFVGKSLLLDDYFYNLTVMAGLGDSTVLVATNKYYETYTIDKDRDAYYAGFVTKAIPNNNLALVVYTETNENAALAGLGGIAGSDDYTPWVIDLYLDGAASGLKYWVEGIYETGSLTKDIDLQAYAIAGGIGMNVAGIDVGLQGAYGSGDSDSDNKVEAYVPVSPDQDNFWKDNILLDDVRANSVSNVWAVAATAAYNVTPALNLKGQVGFYNLVEEEAVADENYLGTELDVQAKLIINEYMSWRVTFGYVFAGDALAQDDDLLELDNEFMVVF